MKTANELFGSNEKLSDAPKVQQSFLLSTPGFTHKRHTHINTFIPTTLSVM